MASLSSAFVGGEAPETRSRSGLIRFICPSGLDGTAGEQRKWWTCFLSGETSVCMSLPVLQWSCLWLNREHRSGRTKVRSERVNLIKTTLNSTRDKPINHSDRSSSVFISCWLQWSPTRIIKVLHNNNCNISFIYWIELFWVQCVWTACFAWCVIVSIEFCRIICFYISC